MYREKQLVHVRFAPDGTVTEIGGRPPALSAQAWFNHLSTQAGASYQPLSGGRGVFRLAPGELETLAPASAA
jgi:hypothetical protein